MKYDWNTDLIPGTTLYYEKTEVQSNATGLTNATPNIENATSQSVATESITLLHFEIEILSWLLCEDTENIEVLELYVIPNVRSEYSEQY